MTNSAFIKNEGYYLSLIGKEDFNSVDPDSGYFSALELEHFHLQVLNLETEYANGMYVISADSEPHYVEGQIEGSAITCDSDHYNEGRRGELRIVLKHKDVHRFRFAIASSHFANVSHIEFYEPSGNVMKRFEGRGGWVDFQVPFADKNSASIARASVYFTIDYGSPVVDSFELWRWEPFS